jgi:hypothetical protein
MDHRFRGCRARALARVDGLQGFQVSRITAYPLRVAEVEDTKTLWRQYSSDKGDKALRDRLLLTYAPLV